MSKKFLPDLFQQEAPCETAYQMTWTQLQPKGYSSAFVQQTREMEEKILKQAKGKALLTEKEAYENGFAQGEKDGLELGKKRLEAVIQHFQKLLTEIEKQREDLYRIHEREMVQLALSVSKKILHRSSPSDEAVILSTLQEAFKHVSDQRKVLVHLNPTDHQYLTTHAEGMAWGLSDVARVKIVKDHSITRGGCLLETAFGDVDGTLENQFDQIVSRVWDCFQQETR